MPQSTPLVCCWQGLALMTSLSVGHL